MLRLNVNMKSTGADAPLLSIGEVAERFGLATHVLRHWETLGLLTPARDAGARRRYRPDDVYRVAVILRAKDAGFSLDDVHAMIATPDPAARNVILRRQQAELHARIAAAQTSLDLIEGALECEHEDFTRCPHFQTTVADRISPNPPAHVRV